MVSNLSVFNSDRHVYVSTGILTAGVMDLRDLKCRPVTIQDVRLLEANIYAPVTGADIQSQLRSKISNAAGLNGMLLTGTTSASLRRYQITFIPAAENQQKITNCRSVTVDTLFIRIFHRILAKRMKAVQINPAQPSFASFNGIYVKSLPSWTLILHRKYQNALLRYWSDHGLEEGIWHRPSPHHWVCYDPIVIRWPTEDSLSLSRGIKNAGKCTHLSVNLLPALKQLYTAAWSLMLIGQSCRSIQMTFLSTWNSVFTLQATGRGCCHNCVQPCWAPEAVARTLDHQNVFSSTVLLPLPFPIIHLGSCLIWQMRLSGDPTKGSFIPPKNRPPTLWYTQAWKWTAWGSHASPRTCRTFCWRNWRTSLAQKTRSSFLPPTAATAVWAPRNASMLCVSFMVLAKTANESTRAVNWRP